MLIRSLIISAFLCAVTTFAQAQTVQLITPDEAKLPNGPGPVTTRAITRGPGIKVLSPDPTTRSIKAPFDLKIVFEPHGGAKIDPSSARLTYLKNPVVDLTERVKSGIKPDGLNITRVAAPAGEHQIRISVKDNEGRETSEVINLIVVN
jgi:hypothetical protein